MTILVVAEKPSVARDIAHVLGARSRHDGYFQSDAHLVTWAVGHLVALAEPGEMKPAWKKWRLGEWGTGGRLVHPWGIIENVPRESLLKPERRTQPFPKRPQ